MIRVASLFLLVSAAIEGALWTLGAFVAWDFNPAHWSLDGRMFIALFGVLGVIAAAGITFAVLENA